MITRVAGWTRRRLDGVPVVSCAQSRHAPPEPQLGPAGATSRPERMPGGALQEDDVLRKPGAAMLAAPRALLARFASLDPRGTMSRVLAVAAVGAVIASAVAGTLPAPSTAIPESQPAAVSADLFSTIGTAHAPTEPLTVAFDAPMNTATVAGALTVEPAAPYTLDWDARGTILTIKPTGHWRPATLYSVVIGRTAESEDGGALDTPLRTVVLTAPGGTAALSTVSSVADRVRPDAWLLIRLDRTATAAAVRASLRSEPAVAGSLVTGWAPDTWVFRPHGPLAPDTTYRFWLEGLRDEDGVPFEATPAISATTVKAPEVARFRPADDATKVKRSARITVRFTEPMDKVQTTGALAVTANGKPVKGRTTWKDGGTLAVFDPKKPLPYGAKVVVSVNLAARSAAGAPVAKAATAKFRVRTSPTEAIPTGAAGAVAGNWLAVERYYLKLMNCTRTGGWVTSSGACSSPGGRNVAPLALSAGISSKVARPYARLLATRGLCSHFIGGSPGDRLRRAGYSSYRWAENIGCRPGNPYSAVLGTHLFYQSEKSWNGGHYRNLMNAAFDRVGIGVWVSGGRARLVVDFYRP